MDSEYDDNIAEIDALLSNSEARILRHQEHLEQLRQSGASVRHAERTLELMLEVLAIMRQMRNGYVTLFRSRLH
jgi:hypothetical protein